MRRSALRDGAQEFPEQSRSSQLAVQYAVLHFEMVHNRRLPQTDPKVFPGGGRDPTPRKACPGRSFDRLPGYAVNRCARTVINSNLPQELGRIRGSSGSNFGRRKPLTLGRFSNYDGCYRSGVLFSLLFGPAAAAVAFHLAFLQVAFCAPEGWQSWAIS